MFHTRRSHHRHHRHHHSRNSSNNNNNNNNEWGRVRRSRLGYAPLQENDPQEGVQSHRHPPLSITTKACDFIPQYGTRHAVIPLGMIPGAAGRLAKRAKDWAGGTASEHRKAMKNLGFQGGGVEKERAGNKISLPIQNAVVGERAGQRNVSMNGQRVTVDRVDQRNVSRNGRDVDMDTADERYMSQNGQRALQTR